MAARTQVNYQLLKAKIDQLDLEELSQPHFVQLLDQTINTARLASILFEKKVLTKCELEKCLAEKSHLNQNLELLKIVIKKKAWEEFIDALNQTENFHILQLLQSVFEQSGTGANCKQPQLDPEQASNFSQVKVPPSSSSSSDIKLNVEEEEEKDAAAQDPKKSQLTSTSNFKLVPTQVSITVLESVDRVKETQSNNKWPQTIRVDNLAHLQEEENTLDWTLVRVTTTLAGDAESPNVYHQFKSTEFHPEEREAILKFLQSTLELDLDKKTIGKSPLELYINTRSFTEIEWERLSKLLHNFCGDSLENLWLDVVNYEEYLKGTKWMKNLNKNNKEQKLWLKKLKVYTFHWPGYSLDRETFDDILGLIKSFNYPLYNFWNESKCRVQILSNSSSGAKQFRLGITMPLRLESSKSPA